MTEPVDAGGMAELIIKLGLMDEYSVRECLFEIEDRKAPADALVRLMQRKGFLTPLQGSKLLKGDTAGYFLGGYRVLYKISSGTFGRVYRGDDPRTGQVVAIKVLRNKWTDNKQKVDLFMREGRVGMTLDHPNIVRILNVNQDQYTGQYFIVMDFVEGDNLRNIIQIRGKLELDESLRMMEECASGLAYAWTRGLTHRDIKPSNILISTDKTTKLVDFGLAEMTSVANIGQMEVARTMDKDEDVAVDRTLDYAGLEKATGVPKGDVRSDIYFLGHVLYEMITGEPLMAVTRDKNVKMQRRRYEEVETNLAKRGPDVGLHPAAQRLIAKAVAFEPHHRFQTPAAFLEAVKATRAEVAGQTDPDAARRASGPLSIFVVEENPRLQDLFRDRFKRMGFRVLISRDPDQAIKRYQQSPYHALLVDCRTAGREGLEVFRKVVKEAHGMRLDLSAVLFLGEDQGAWAEDAETLPGATVFVGDPTMKQLTHALRNGIPELRKQAAPVED
jgi:serine/threonine protein kinase